MIVDNYFRITICRERYSLITALINILTIIKPNQKVPIGSVYSIFCMMVAFRLEITFKNKAAFKTFKLVSENHRNSNHQMPICFYFSFWNVGYE